MHAATSSHLHVELVRAGSNMDFEEGTVLGTTMAVVSWLFIDLPLLN